MFASDHTKVLSKESTAPGIEEYERYAFHKAPHITFNKKEFFQRQRKANVEVTTESNNNEFEFNIVDIIPFHTERISGYSFFIIDNVSGNGEYQSPASIVNDLVLRMSQIPGRSLEIRLIINQNGSVSHPIEGTFTFIDPGQIRWFPTAYFNSVYEDTKNDIKLTFGHGILKLLCEESDEDDEDAYNSLLKTIFWNELGTDEEKCWQDLVFSEEGLSMTYNAGEGSDMKEEFPTFNALQVHIKTTLRIAYQKWCEIHEIPQRENILLNLDVGIRH